jgi:hypothetical protein
VGVPTLFIPIGMNWDATSQIEVSGNHPQASVISFISSSVSFK